MAKKKQTKNKPAGKAGARRKAVLGQMCIEKVPVNRINPAPYNPRKDLQPGDTDYEALKASISEWGIVQPLVWNRRTGNLVGGHQRYKILLESKPTEIEQVVVVELDPVAEKRLNLAMNRIQGGWDMGKLADILTELDQLNASMEATGFTAGEIEDIVVGPVNLPEPTQLPPMTTEGEVENLSYVVLVFGTAEDIDGFRRDSGMNKTQRIIRFEAFMEKWQKRKQGKK